MMFAVEKRFIVRPLLCLVALLIGSRSSAFAFQSAPLIRHSPVRNNIIYTGKSVPTSGGTALYPQKNTPSTALSAAAAAPVVIAAAAVGALPTLKTVALACLLPTSLGFAKIEYGVGYGYGTSVALVAGLVLHHQWPQFLCQLSQLPALLCSTSGGGLCGCCTSLTAVTAPQWHALALVFYGLRLNLFLLYREVRIPHFRKVRDNIEAKRGSSKNRLTRLPLVLSCAALYACMAAPLWITSPAVAVGGAFTEWQRRVFYGCVATTWAGFGLAALGDAQKSFVKGVLGSNVLVKGGVFQFLRHPNYTGEIIGWTASVLASVVTLVATDTLPVPQLPLTWPLEWSSKVLLGPAVASLFGWLGIVWVLMQAATGLEKKQRIKYRNTLGYRKYLRRSWAGPTFSTKNK